MPKPNATSLPFDAIPIASAIDELAILMRSMSDPHSKTEADLFHKKIGDIARAADDVPRAREALLTYCFQATAGELDRSHVHHHGRNKPFGYAGDYQIIDWTYQKFDGSPDPRGMFWDHFYHAQVAPMAVRDRKERFGRVLKSMAGKDKIRVLNVGSGPAREIVDGAKFAGLGPDDIEVLCLEIDPRAVAYARKLLGREWAGSVDFHVGNALRYKPKAHFDLVWSAGLFDYLEDRVAALLLKNLWRSVDAGGRMIVGNFAETHPTRPWIEWCGNWHLIHRNPAGLHAIAGAAGVADAMVTTDSFQAIHFLEAVKAEAPVG